MRHAHQLLLGITLGALILGPVPGRAITITDTYIGDTTGGGSGDVYGPPDEYDVISMEANRSGDALEVIIKSNFFSDWSDGYNPYDPGDLFVSTNGWHPDGDSATGYLTDNHLTGEEWEFAIDLGDLTSLPSSGTALVYATNQGTIANGAERTLQEASFQPSNGVDGLAAGNWTINSDLLTITLPTAFASNGLGWDFDTLAFHWTMTCGNDVIEGQTSPVPEPASMLLFGAGLIGLAGLRRR